MKRNISCVIKPSNQVVDERFCNKNFSEDVESELMEKEVADLTTTASCYVSCHHDCTVSEWSQWSQCQHEKCTPQTSSKNLWWHLGLFSQSFFLHIFFFSWCKKTYQTHRSVGKGSPWKMFSSSLGDRVRLRTALWYNFQKYSFQVLSCHSVLSISVDGERWRCFLSAVGWPSGRK